MQNQAGNQHIVSCKVRIFTRDLQEIYKRIRSNVKIRRDAMGYFQSRSTLFSTIFMKILGIIFICLTGYQNAAACICTLHNDAELYFEYDFI